jgi:hypothetical protein
VRSVTVQVPVPLPPNEPPAFTSGALMTGMCMRHSGRTVGYSEVALADGTLAVERIVRSDAPLCSPVVPRGGLLVAAAADGTSVCQASAKGASRAGGARHFPQQRPQHEVCLSTV